MFTHRSRNGNMPAEPVRPRAYSWGKRLRRAMLITHRVVLAKRVMRATMPPTLGAFSICTEMSGSGRRTGTGTYSSGAQTDPTGAASGSTRVLRGGFLEQCRHGPAFGLRRTTTPRASATTALGFRVGFQKQ